jgi:uncharacterized membrane protein YhfC
MNTLQTVATIPAFMAGSMLWLRRRDDAAVVALAFGGIGFALSVELRSPDEHGTMSFGGCKTPTTQRNTKV